MKRTLYFNQVFWKKLNEKAEEKGMKISEYIRFMLNKMWEKEGE